jgi:hydroxymethylpyrimidine/phosphomethylpyrimidine kinase
VNSGQTKPEAAERPITIVVVGGVDPTGGAGLLRDVATARALGAHAHAVGTAWTEQGPGVHRVEPREPGAVGQALAEALARQPAAVKVGMAVGPATAAAIVEALAGYGGPVVVDPVLASSRGGALWAGTPDALLPLARRAALVTPNAPEAAALVGHPAKTPSEAEAAGKRLVDGEGLAAVLVKGGHLADGNRVTDVLITAQTTTRFSRPRAEGPIPRGTGCALATVIAIELGGGLSLEDAVARAGDWLARAIATARPVGGDRHL